MRITRLLLIACIAVFHIGSGLAAGEAGGNTAVSRFSAAMLTGPGTGADNESDDAPIQVAHRSAGKAFLLSMLVPGTGEMMLGNRKMAVVFFSTELTLWTSYFLLNWFSDVRASDYRLYAASHAGIDMHGKDDQYYVDIENFTDISAYNQAMLQQRRPQLMYPENTSYDWSWDSENAMNKYRRIRINSDQFKNAGLFMIGGVVLNHLISGIDAVRIARKTPASSSADRSVHVHVAGLPEGGVRVSLWKGF
ncbi:hypothetical protein JW948_16680 [bacterium]|nr:hypothetical protein [bacterium]